MGFMKTEQEQIKAIKQIIDERVETTLGQVQGRHDNVIKTVDTVIIARDIVNAGYGDVSEYKAEIERLKAENCELTKRLGARFTCDFVRTAQKQAVQEFADKVKDEVYPFLQAEMYNKKHFIVSDSINDKALENQNIGILKAQDVLSKWFKVKIDELVKEIRAQ